MKGKSACACAKLRHSCIFTVTSAQVPTKKETDGGIIQVKWATPPVFMTSDSTIVQAHKPDHRAEASLCLLMAGYQEGNVQAVEELVRRLSPPLWRYFLGSTSRNEAEDLMQECWIRIHKARHTYRPSEPLLPWVYAIARHTRLDEYRKRRRREMKELLVAVPPDVPEQDSSASNTPDWEGMLRELPESQREVILMLKFSGMSLQEVAGATASTVGAVKQKAHRAYEKLRQLLDREGR